MKPVALALLARGVCTHLTAHHAFGAFSSAPSSPRARVKDSMLAIYDLTHHFVEELPEKQVFAKFASEEQAASRAPSCELSVRNASVAREDKLLVMSGAGFSLK